MVAAIIAARGGSQRLPRKNVLPFCGLPLVAWSIIQAKCSHLIDGVWLSTDDDEIAAIGEEYGAQIIRRPDWPDANEASAARPLIHAMRLIQDWHPDFDLSVSILPTGPVRKPEDIDRLVTLWRDTGGDPHCTHGYPEPQIFLRKEVPSGGFVAAVFSKNYDYWRHHGHAAVLSPERYYREFGKKDLDAKADADLLAAIEAGEVSEKNACYYSAIERWQVQDTDTAEEFEFAEVVMEHYLLKGRGPQIYYDYKDQP